MTLEEIKNELFFGNLSVLTNEAYWLIAKKSLELLDKKDFKQGSIEASELKDLILIANVLYNRSDVQVLPIEDQVYDRLMEIYKKLDPNFQVGSYIVQYQSAVEEAFNSGVRQRTVNPFEFLPKQEKKDEVRQYYADQLNSFNKGRYTFQDVFYERNPIRDNGPLKKGTYTTAHNHPSLVGTLDKAKFVLDADAIEKDLYEDPTVSILERDFFQKHLQMGIIRPDQEIEMVLELKYDGISVEADCTNEVLSARTRGDTGIGQAVDISDILAGYQFPRNEVLKDRIVGVKFEAIINYIDLQRFNQARGKTYANCRTAMIGLFGSSDAYLYRDYITLVPLALDRENVPEIKNRMEEIELLNKLYCTKGEPLRYCYIKGTYEVCLFLIKKFLEECYAARSYMNFMFDGIVVSYLDEDIRARLGRVNYVNKYSIAVKFSPESKLTTFLGYTFNIGQSGNICPMIHYTPVDFFGTVHPKSSGASKGRFDELALRTGDIIEVTYTNDVMPYVRKVDCEQNRQNKNSLCEFPKVCPCCGALLEVSKSGDSARCPNWHCPERTVARLAATLDKLGISGFAEESIRRLDFRNFSDFLVTPEIYMREKLGEADGKKLFSSIEQLKMTPITDYQFMAALGFTKLGLSTWKKIFCTMDILAFINLMNDMSDMAYAVFQNIKGIGKSIVETICKEYDLFASDIELITQQCVVMHDIYPSEEGLQIRFTGCRNNELEKELCMRGHDASGTSSVTKKTNILIIPYEGFTSTKTTKVSDQCVKIPLPFILADKEAFFETYGL